MILVTFEYVVKCLKHAIRCLSIVAHILQQGKHAEWLKIKTGDDNPPTYLWFISRQTTVEMFISKTLLTHKNVWNREQ